MFLENISSWHLKLESQLCYFGVSGHGKGLVDAMSGFGVKSPLRKAVVTEDLHYDSAHDIVSYLQELFKDDPYKIHFELRTLRKFILLIK